MLVLYNLDNSFIKITEEFPDNFTGIIEWPDGSKEWCTDDKLHRLDGPAFIDLDGKNIGTSMMKRSQRLDVSYCMI